MSNDAGRYLIHGHSNYPYISGRVTASLLIVTVEFRNQVLRDMLSCVPKCTMLLKVCVGQ